MLWNHYEWWAWQVWEQYNAEGQAKVFVEVVCPITEPVEVDNRWIYHTGSPIQDTTIWCVLRVFWRYTSGYDITATQKHKPGFLLPPSLSGGKSRGQQSQQRHPYFPDQSRDVVSNAWSGSLLKAFHLWDMPKIPLQEGFQEFTFATPLAAPS